MRGGGGEADLGKKISFHEGSMAIHEKNWHLAARLTDLLSKNNKSKGGREASALYKG